MVKTVRVCFRQGVLTNFCTVSLTCASAVEALETNYLDLPELLCIMAFFNSHIQAEEATFEADQFADAGETMLLIHADR